MDVVVECRMKSEETNQEASLGRVDLGWYVFCLAPRWLAVKPYPMRDAHKGTWTHAAENGLPWV